MGKRRSCGHQATGVTGVNLWNSIRITANDHKRGGTAIATKSGQEPEKGIELRQVDLSYREVTDLYSILKEECRQNSPAAIVVTGIEASLRGPLLALLNVQRDLISRESAAPCSSGSRTLP